MEATVTSTAPDSRSAKAVLRTQRIELPSWAFGNSGTRFNVFGQKGIPRTPYEKIDDAAQVNRFTGVAPTVAPPHSLGQGRRLRGPGAARRGTGCRARHDQLEHLPGRRLHARQRLPPRRPHQQKRSTISSNAVTSWTRRGRATSSCGSRTARTTPVRTTSGLARTGWLSRCGRSTSGSARTSEWSSSTSSSSPPSTTRRAGLGHVVHPLRRPRTQGEGRRRHGPPCAGHEHRVHRRSLLRADKLGGFDFNSSSTRTTI